MTLASEQMFYTSVCVTSESMHEDVICLLGCSTQLKLYKCPLPGTGTL